MKILTHRISTLARTLLVILIPLCGISSASAITYHYFSGGGANGNWSTAGNWVVNGVPPANNTNIGIVFLSGANNKTSIVDIAGIMVRSIEFLQISNHVITSPVARTLTLIGQGRTNPAVRMVVPSNLHYGRFIFDSNIELVVSNECWFAKDYSEYFSSSPGNSANDTLVIAGRISGSGALWFSERTTFNHLNVTFQGSLGNTYTGLTSITNGVTLYLDKSSGSGIAGNLSIENLWGGVVLLRDNQLANTSSITNWGFVDLNNHNDTVGELHLFDGSSVSTGTGLLTLGGDVYADYGTSSLYGRVALGTPSDSRIGRKFIAEGAQVLQVYASVSGSAILRKVGSGQLSLLRSNSYSGLTVLETGKTVIGHSNALGSVVGNTYIGNSAKMSFDGDAFPTGITKITCAEPLDIAPQGTNAPNPFQIAIEAINAYQVTLTGSITLNGDARFYEDVYDGLRIQGPISGPGRFRAVSGEGGIYFEGTATNAFSGGAWAEVGALYLKRPPSARSIPGGLAISGSVFTEFADQLTANNWIVISNTGALTIRSNQSLASLEGTGNVTLGATLSLGASGSNSVFSGKIENYFLSITGSLKKLGNGTFTLLGTNLCTGTTTVSAGQYFVHGSAALSPITLGSGTTLGGTGIVGEISGTGGLVTPGPNKAALRSSSVSMNANHMLSLELGGTNSGVNADILRVTGGVNLANTPLALTLTSGGSPGTKYTLIDNDGVDAVIGTFNGLPQAATFTVNGILFQISYTGGTGNDVVVTQLINAPSPSISKIQKQPGGAVLIQGAGLPGVSYDIQATISLTPPAWITIGSVDANQASGLIEFTDPDASGLPMRFYRLAIQ